VSGAFSYFEVFILMMGTISFVAAAVHWVMPFSFYSTRWAELLLIRNGACFALGSLIWLIAFAGFSWIRAFAATAFLSGALIEIAITASPGNRGSTALPALLFLVSVAAMLLAIYAHGRPCTRVSARLLSLTRAAGSATYPLYLIHNVVGASLLRIFVNTGFGDTGALVLSLASIAIIVALVVTIVERGLRRLFAELVKSSAIKPLPDTCRVSSQRTTGPCEGPFTDASRASSEQL
jgi:peptidoglycan/LPS O-acetylase OafA/YrhL